MPKNNKSGKKRSGLGKGLSALMGPSLHDVAENTATEYESGHDAVIDTSASNAVTSNAATGNAVIGNATTGNATISNVTASNARENGKAVTDTMVGKATVIDNQNEEKHISTKEVDMSAKVQNDSIAVKPTPILNEAATQMAGTIGADISDKEIKQPSKEKSSSAPTYGAQLMDLTLIHPNKNQPRKNFANDEMVTLIESIKTHGIIQPIVVRPIEDYFQIVAGERRWRAANEAGLKEVPVIVKNYSTEEMTEIALVENLQRQDLDPIEEAFAYKRLAEIFNFRQEDIALRLGRSRSHVANMMRLLQLPEFLRNELSAGELSIGQARPLLGLPNEDLQRTALEQIKEYEMTARQVEALVRQLLAGPKKERTTKAENIAEVRALTDRLRVSLGVPVAVKLKAGKKVQGKIEVTFRSQEELDHILQYMEQETNKDDEAITSFHI
ncbi:ParB/RepB/Spo0J family partition protein [uncultured Veillonella sp.]|uniref:ParB/RepB/Spo0J family partition protein n=1 Tax=uncultured Veillonella sp. TaxID=159268 RepID=UPI002584D324|nr:ParB/RepB/Spo0J family partition protein [uncultured Veillonella sp.]